MAKIHTHYDNLKVARLAPAEVIRAAYKALSQKYHPDKNPGDEKAARIMAILNSAYTTLSDPVRRREHDEWIAAEEWEIEWLESTRAEEKQRGEAPPAWEPSPVEAPPRWRRLRDPTWWFGLALCFALGCVAGILVMRSPVQSRVMPAALATALAHKPDAAVRADIRADAIADKAAEKVADQAAEKLSDAWAVRRAQLPDGVQRPPDIKSLAVTQLVIPARAPDCSTELHSLLAPNGEAWPSQSGYVEGFPVGNQGKEVQISIDNTRNGSPVLVKIYDLDRRSNVRHVYVLAQDSIVIDKLSAGKYEVRYQNVDVGGSAADCASRREKATLVGPAEIP